MTLVDQTRDHLCHCGKWGAFGHGMFPGRQGTWYCREHNPQKLEAPKVRDYVVKRIRGLADAEDPSSDWEGKHKADGSHRPGVIDDCTTVGWYGEKAFAALTGYPAPDRTYKPEGDGGIDFTIPFETPAGRRDLTIDVKAARNPVHLICETGKVRADIFVLAAYVEDLDLIRFMGWEWKVNVRAAQVRVFKGPEVHAIHCSVLRKMGELLDRMAAP